MYLRSRMRMTRSLPRTAETGQSEQHCMPCYTTSGRSFSGTILLTSAQLVEPPGHWILRVGLRVSHHVQHSRISLEACHT